MKEIATIILNRNLPKQTNKLVNISREYDGNISDIYVIEAGSDLSQLSKYCTWHVNDKKTIRQGLRYCNGMNYGLFKLWKEKKLFDYKAILLLTNDTLINNKKFITPLYKELKSNSQIGLISPCGEEWGEKEYLKKTKTKFFYYIHNHAYLINIDLIKKIYNPNPNSYKEFFFDGNNFRGYGTEIEIIAKCYYNDFAAAITSKVICKEDETLLKRYYKSIKTEEYKINQKLYFDEGNKWMRKKYGFSNKWDMIFYAKNVYDKFFDYHPNLNKYKL